MKYPHAVLLIDDDPVHLQIYGWLLQSAGFHAYPALFVGESVQLPENQKIDVAILDYRISGKLDIHEATRLIREAFPSVPIILLADVYDMTDAMARSITTFVRKGEPAKLIAAVHQYAQ